MFGFRLYPEFLNNEIGKYLGMTFELYFLEPEIDNYSVISRYIRK
jgi:hypothetical protein